METHYNAVSCNCPKDLTANRSFQASLTRVAAVSSSRSLDLDLVTEEGDKVTLSIDTRASAVYAAHGKVGMEDDRLHGEWGEFSGGSFEREVVLSVEGDLNRQERREIRKVIKTLTRMMNNFVEGRLNPMMAKAQKLQGFETIERLEVDMSYERRVMVARQTEAAVSYDRIGGAKPDGEKPVRVVESPVKREAEVVKKEAEMVAMEMASEVVSAQSPMDPLKELADRLLRAYRDRAVEMNAFAGRIMDHIRDIFEAAVDEDGRAVFYGDDD